jgi:hypothetical protein
VQSHGQEIWPGRRQVDPGLWAVIISRYMQPRKVKRGNSHRILTPWPASETANPRDLTIILPSFIIYFAIIIIFQKWHRVQIYMYLAETQRTGMVVLCFIDWVHRDSAV